jgi:hypothetical protein
MMFGRAVTFRISLISELRMRSVRLANSASQSAANGQPLHPLIGPVIAEKREASLFIFGSSALESL